MASKKKASAASVGVTSRGVCMAMAFMWHKTPSPSSNSGKNIAVCSALAAYHMARLRLYVAAALSINGIA